jgi:hypothetical protein
MGRWMSPDWSVTAEPVPYAKLENPQSLNLYQYVGNNPLIAIDADGHDNSCNFNGLTCQGSKTSGEVLDDANDEAERQREAAQQQGQQKSDAAKKPTKKPDRGGRRRAPRTDKPPIPLPAGPKGQPNSWIPVPGSQDRDYGPRFQPEFTVPGGKNGAQPNAWWDPDDGYWSLEPGNGGSRGHYDEWGNRVSKMAVLGAEIVTAIRIMNILNELDEATGP